MTKYLYIFIVLFFFTSCQYPGNDSGRLGHVPRPTSSEFYKRGLEYAFAKEWQRAKSDFETAIGRRPGVTYPKVNDSRWIRTYGLHYLHHYFPHRELGICLYYLGKLEAGEVELLRSLQMLPTSRSTYYLNLLRKAKVEELSVTPNQLRLIDEEGKRDLIQLNTPNLALSRFKITSPYYVSSLEVNRAAIHVGLAEKELKFDEDEVIELDPEQDKILMKVADLAGNELRRSFQIVYDFEGPVISFTKSSTERGLRLHVFIRDNHELMQVRVDGKELALSNQQQVKTSYDLIEDQEVMIRAQDGAGNEVLYTVPKGILGEEDQAKVEENEPIQAVQIASSVPMVFTPKPLRFEVATSHTGKKPAYSDEKNPIPTLWPSILLSRGKKLLSANQEGCNEKFTDRFTLTIEVKDPSFIEYLDIFGLQKKGGHRVTGFQCGDLKNLMFTQVLLPKDEKQKVTFRAKNCKFEPFREIGYCFVKGKSQEKVLAYVQPFSKSGSQLERVDETFIYRKVYNLLTPKPAHTRPNGFEQSRFAIGEELEFLEKFNPKKLEAILSSKEIWFIKGELTPWPEKTDEGWELKVTVEGRIAAGNGKLLAVHQIAEQDLYFYRFDMENIDAKLRWLLASLIDGIPSGRSRVTRKHASPFVEIEKANLPGLTPGMVFWFSPNLQPDLPLVEVDSFDPRLLSNGSNPTMSYVKGVLVDNSKEDVYQVEILDERGWPLIREGDIAILL